MTTKNKLLTKVVKRKMTDQQNQILILWTVAHQKSDMSTRVAFA